MKLKVFSGFPEYIEKEFNDWINTNESIIIEKMSSADNRLYVTYRERPNTLDNK